MTKRRSTRTRTDQEQVVGTVDASLPPAAASAADATPEPEVTALDAEQETLDTPEPVAVEPVQEPEPENLCAPLGPEGPVGEPEPEPAPEPVPAPAAPKDNDAELRVRAENIALRQQLLAQAETIERHVADAAVDTTDDIVPEHTYFFRGTEGTIWLSRGTERFDHELNRMVTDKPALPAKFHGGFWKTTSRYEVMLMEKHMAFTSGKVKDVGQIKLNRKRALEAQLANMDEMGNALGPAPSFAGVALPLAGTAGTAGISDAAQKYGDLTLPTVKNTEVQILPRGAVSGNH